MAQSNKSESEPERLAEFGSLDDQLAIARQRYIEKNPDSLAAFEVSTDSMPGGNTRTVLFNDPFPLRMVSGKGCRITDADGHEYVNLLGEYTAGLFGHDNQIIKERIIEALDRGVNLSGHNLDEVKLAQLVCDRFPSIDKVRFTNSGTEANLLAVSAARYVTGRKQVLVFEGGYHGGLLYFGGGGMPLNVPFDYIVGKYNDVEQTMKIFQEKGEDIACVLVEPMQGAAGCIPASHEFLSLIREKTHAFGNILIFDEVMTSRFSSQGAQGYLGIIPDMTTLGKYIGGGMTFGAFGGKEEIMKIFDPRTMDFIPHAGTFNNNTISMAAGVAAMSEVLDSKSLDRLNEQGNTLRLKLNQIAKKYDAAVQFTGQGSLIAMHTTKNQIDNTDDLVNADDRIKEIIFLDLLEQGYYIARRGFISLMLTIEEKEIYGFCAAFDKVISRRQDLLGRNDTPVLKSN